MQGGTTMRCAAAVLAAAAILTPRAAAQIVIEDITFDGDFEFPPGLVIQGGAPVAGAKAASEEKPTPRAEKLKKLEYDRRASKILEAWSTPPAAEKTESKAEEKPAPSADAVAPPLEEKKDDSSGEVKPQDPPEEPAAEETSATSGESAEGEAEAAANAEQAAAAAEAQRKAEEEAARKKAEAEAIEKEAAALQRNVTLGSWSAVSSYFGGLTDGEHKAGYDQMLTSLRNGPKQRPQVPQQGMAYVEKNVFAPADVVGLASARRGDISKENLQALGAILAQALESGHQIQTFLDEVRPSLDQEGAPFSRRSLAHVLVHAGRPYFLDGLLPSLEQAREQDDRDGLNLLSRYYLARYDDDKKVEWLEQAWHATQAVLAVGEVDKDAKAEALKRAVDIAPKIREELGAHWLDESFTSRPERGMEILATIGAATSTSLAAEPLNAEKRLKLIELQSTATKALLEAAPQLADEWKDELEVLADAWLREAQFTYQFDESSASGPRMQRDFYGNFFYFDGGYSRRGNMPTPLKTSDILETRPTDDWLARIDPTLQPRFQMLFAQLLLKAGEDALAFPYVEALARKLPTQAESLAAEFLRVWTQNHDPNGASRRQSNYIFFYGFEERASGIPLTRSKQDRNLRELGEWVTRLRALNVELDENLLANAFKTAHSSAEIYRLETIEQIFGPMETLETEMLAGLIQSMRANLLTVWRDPALQKDKKTNRKQQDIEAEVRRGYELARATLGRALDKHPGDWRLALAEASVQHDENNYIATLKKDSEFAGRRNAALANFARAADLYAAGVGELDASEESTEPYELWFYAALGATDLNAVEPKHVLAAGEIEKIRGSLEALPKDRAERHFDRFASSLFARMSNANPGVKFRYVREGLAIVGDNKLAREARSVLDYYNDLVTEIQLVASIDGSTRVGHGRPFGLRIDIRHTREIERESGGFGKYLQNQNNQPFAFNYGRPTEDYRDKFEEAARETLGEHFNVRSVTFNDPKAHSIADATYGWRRTPYAYVLLEPRGPQIDKLPSLRLDLDFLDTSGYAVLPIETSELPLDASDPAGDVRPYERVALTQVLDERQARDGKLLVEIKASALGLVPELEELVDLDAEGFEIVGRDDQGVAVVKFDEEADGVVSERMWTLTLRAKDESGALPERFEFGDPKVDAASSEYFRYVDADLASVERIVPLEHRYGEKRTNWFAWIGAVVAAGSVAGFVALRARKRPAAERDERRFRTPESPTAFNVLGLLRQIHANNGLAPNERSELEREIETLERRYFAADGEADGDLRQVAARWVARAR